MNIEIFKYALKVWIASLLFSIPLTLMILKAFEIIFIDEDPSFFSIDYSWGYLFFRGQELIYTIPFFIVFSLLSQLHNNLFAKTRVIKILLTLLSILAFGIICLIDLNFLASANALLLLAFLFLSIIFIWVFKLDKSPIKEDLNNILDA